jgi:hypothetical protein
LNFNPLVVKLIACQITQRGPAAVFRVVLPDGAHTLFAIDDVDFQVDNHLRGFAFLEVFGRLRW